MTELLLELTTTAEQRQLMIEQVFPEVADSRFFDVANFLIKETDPAQRWLERLVRLRPNPLDLLGTFECHCDFKYRSGIGITQSSAHSSNWQSQRKYSPAPGVSSSCVA